VPEGRTDFSFLLNEAFSEEENMGEVCRLRGIRLGRIAVALTLLFGMCVNVHAFDIPTGNEDIELRWDNTFRYTLGYRVDGQNDSIIGNANMDDGDRNFDKGIVSNRLDILSEADLIYKRDYGVRVSGAFWYDQRYHDHLDNTSAATSNHLESGVPVVNKLNAYDRKYFAGPDGELLDAFAFGKINIGDVPVRVRVGRHTVYWGESLLFNGVLHGICYAQMPLDVGKANAQPGAEIKELFRPTNHVSFLVQPTDALTIAGQYFLEWESNKYSEAGTYLSGSDVMINGEDGSMIIMPGVRLTKGVDVTPDYMRDWGVSARWQSEWLDGTLGFYYRNFSDRIPQAHLMLGPYVNGTMGTYHMVYAQDIDLYGISFAKQVFGISVGAELSYRRNMPLASDVVMVSTLPDEGDTFGARGDTWHAVLNCIGMINNTLFFDTAQYQIEFVWNGLDHVTQGDAYYKGRDGYTAADRSTRNYFGCAVSFVPTWFQVFQGVDLSLPLSVSTGLSGTSAVTSGGKRNDGSYAVGVGAEIFNKYKIDLKYVDFFGSYDTDPVTGAYTAGGGNSALSDRGMVVLTLKVTY
jgi:hypothetical protein